MRKMLSKLAVSSSVSLGTVAVLLVSIAAVLLVIYLAIGLPGGDREVIEEIVASQEEAAPQLNTGQVIDATNRRDVEAQEGYRYEVIIEDQATDGVAGVAFIGGLVTFVDGTRVGERVVVEVTRLKSRTAEAVVVERLGMSQVQGRSDRRKERPSHTESAGPVQVGKTYSGTVDDLGSKGDGIVHVEGKVVFVEGAAVGEKVSFVVTEDLGRFAVGELVAGASTASQNTRSASATKADDVQAGDEYEVIVEEKDRKNPDVNGVARIDGLVVFVPETQPGDRVRIRIRERKPRFAFAEIVARLDDTTDEDGRTADQ